MRLTVPSREHPFVRNWRAAKKFGNYLLRAGARAALSGNYRPGLLALVLLLLDLLC